MAKNTYASIDKNKTNSTKYATVNNNEDLDANAETQKAKKEKKVKELTPEAAAKKIEKERAEKLKKSKAEKYSNIIDEDLALKRFQWTEKQKTIRKIIINGIILLVGLGAIGFLATQFNVMLAGLALPLIGITGFNIFKAVKFLLKLKNPYYIKQVLIIREAKAEHIKKNKKIQESYQAEKKRIKSLKKLPYKALGSVSFMLTMLTLIFCYFVLNIQLTTTILLLFAVFTFSYFIVGIAMASVFYLVSEHKTREYMIQLEEEKRRLYEEEKVRSELQMKRNLEAERRKYEEEELLRIEEETRTAMEAEIMKARKEEERRSFEISMHEKQRILNETRFAKPILLEKNYEELEKEREKQKNKFENKLLDGIKEEMNNFNLGGIENFHSMKKFEGSYDFGGDDDITPEELEMEMSNSLLSVHKGESSHAASRKTVSPIMPDLPSSSTERKVNPKSVSIIKEMLK